MKIEEWWLDKELRMLTELGMLTCDTFTDTCNNFSAEEQAELNAFLDAVSEQDEPEPEPEP